MHYRDNPHLTNNQTKHQTFHFVHAPSLLSIDVMSPLKTDIYCEQYLILHAKAMAL